jgi:Domain of unknown function (DUF2341)
MLVRTHRKSFGYARCGILLLVVLALLGMVMPVMACDGGWYNNDWSNRKPITIDHTRVVSDQKDFPVMVSLGSDTDLVAHAQNGAGDLVFTLADGTTKIPCKVESYSRSNGALVAWVKVPTLSSSEDTKLYLYYGNAAAKDQQDTSSSTWTDTYKGNWRKRDIVSWVQTEYNNHNNPSGFCSKSSQESRPQVVTPTPTPTPTVTPTPTPAPTTDTPTQTSQWSDCGWTYRRAITIDHTKVAADQTDFPVLISLTSDAGLTAHAQPSGNDILFTLGDQKTKVPHRIESYTSTTGALVAWVKVPTLSSTTNTVLYMYYGDPTASVQQDASGSWSYRFKGTWNRDAVKSWVMTKYNNQMNPSTFYALGPETFPPQSCSPTPAPTMAPDQTRIVVPVDSTPAPVDPAVTPAPVDPAVTPTPVDTTPVPTSAFSCPAGSYGLVTGDGELAGCVAITNDWSVNETTDEYGNVTDTLVDTVSVAYSMADGYCLQEANVAIGYDTDSTPLMFPHAFDATACARDFTFTYEMPFGTDDVAYLYITPTGTVQKSDGTGTQDVTSPDNPIYYTIQG